MLLRVAVLWAICSTVFATDWYVRPSTGEYGDEDGTSYAAAFDGFADHNAACASIQAGDTVKIDGTFSGEQLIPCPGSSSGHITYTYYDSASPPTLDANASSTAPVSSNNIDYWKLVGPLTIQNGTGNAVNIFGGSSNVVIDGITITGFTNDGSGAILRGRDMVNFEVKNCTVHTNSGEGIAVDIGNGNGGGRTIRIHGNTTHGNTHRGIYVTGDADDRYTDVEIYDNTTYGNGDGIYVANTDNYKIYDNYSYSNTLTTYGSAEGYGLGVQQCKNGKIYRNRFISNRTDNVEIWGDSTVQSSNNHFFANFSYGALGESSSGAGIECPTSDSPGCLIYGNVLVENVHNIRIDDDATGTSAAFNNTIVGGTYGLLAREDAVGWTLKNNIFYDNQWVNTLDNQASIQFQNNQWNSATENSSYNGTAYSSANITSLDASALTSSPSFVATGSAQAKDYYRSSPGAAVYDAGVHVYPRGSADGGRCTGGTPDIGAFCNDIVIQEGYNLRPKPRR